MELVEIEHMGVKVDKCTHCGASSSMPANWTTCSKHVTKKDYVRRILNVFR